MMDDGHETGGHQETRVIGEGKLLIKLKISQVREDEQMIESSTRKVEITRVCDVCKKGFSSGKALGGHMRIHVQANKEPPLKKLKTNQHKPTNKIKQQEEQEHDYVIESANGSSSVIMSNSSCVPTCSICNKKFPSMKSLFGHMRCHPERPWRGIQPRPAAPPKTSPPSSSVSDSLPRQLNDVDDQIAVTVTDTDVTDLTQALPRWSVTARRGRKALSATSSAASSSEEEELRDAVEGLMRLAQGNSLQSGLTQKHVVEEFEATNSNSMTDKAEIKVYESKKRRIIETNPVEYMRDSALKIVISTPPPTDKYKCSTCNKSFPTHQALGGHRSSHYKFKNFNTTTTSTIQESLSPAVEDEDNVESSAHQCKICSKSFPTGQALGGHKRCHWTALVEAPSSQVTSPWEASQMADQKVLEFDLNELPAMEFDQEGVESADNGDGYCYPSSSYNSFA